MKYQRGETDVFGILIVGLILLGVCGIGPCAESCSNCGPQLKIQVEKNK